MLDLSAAFDIVDNTILLTRLKQLIGIHGTALDWFCSCFHETTFSVMMDDCVSPLAALPCGVPQGSILTHLLFNLHILSLASILKKKQNIWLTITFILSTHLYVSLKPHGPVHPLLDRLGNIKNWLSLNFLILNDDKTEGILFCNSHSCPV